MQHNLEHKDRLMKERDIRILLVDDHDLVLQGLKRIVECSLPEIKNVCTASSGQEALLLIASQRFNLFVLDMELPDISGMDIIVRIREKDPQARIIVNTNTVDTHRRHLMDKLDARNVADLIMTAISKGIIPIRKC